MKEGLEFKGCDVDDAINAACEKMGADREELNIKILSTGSSGIFGLLKKKAVVIASLRSLGSGRNEEVASPVADRTEGVEGTDDPASADNSQADSADRKKSERKDKRPRRPKFLPRDPEPVPEELQPVIIDELKKLLALMGLEGDVAVSVEDQKSKFDVSGPCVSQLIAQDGQALDGLQYLLRKITSSALPDRASFVVDADGFRFARRNYLQEQALHLAGEVKDKKVTRTIPPLNPAERRIVHMALQDDKSIRSRSVGNGFFKKIIIYVPGSRRRPPRRRAKSGRK